MGLGPCSFARRDGYNCVIAVEGEETRCFDIRIPSLHSCYGVSGKSIVENANEPADSNCTLIFGVPDQDTTIEIIPLRHLLQRGRLPWLVLTDDRGLRAGHTNAPVGADRRRYAITERIGLDDPPSAFDRMENAEGLKKVQT